MPRLRNGSASPINPARSFSSASSLLTLLSAPRSPAAVTRRCDNAAAASVPTPIETNKFPKLPDASSACCLDMPSASAAPAANACTPAAASPKMTTDLPMLSFRSDAALTGAPNTLTMPEKIALTPSAAKPILPSPSTSPPKPAPVAFVAVLT